MALADEWLEGASSLLRKAWTEAPEQSSSFRRAASVEPVPDEAGWYEVQGRLSASDLDSISEGNLTYGSGDQALAFDILEVALDDEQVRVRASTAAPRERLSLLIRRTDIRKILAGLGNGLKAARENPLLRQLAERRLSPVQRDLDLASVHSWPSLRDAQKQAVSACCSSGLQLVWGPPGTGKTHVIAAAISYLVRSGQRVLLVSNNNIAVDTALREAIEMLGTAGAGQAIRAGNISLPVLAANDSVRLDRLVEARQARQRAIVDGLARQLEELAQVGVRLAESEKRIVGFAPDLYQRAAERLDNRRRHEELSAALALAALGFDRARTESGIHEKRLLSLACCEAADREEEVRRNLADIDAALAAHQEASFVTRSRRPGLRSRLAATRTSLASELARAAAAGRKAVDDARRAGADPRPAIRPDPAEAAAAAERARRALAAAEGDLHRLEREISGLVQAGLAEPADEQFLATEQPRWLLYKELPHLRTRAREAAERRVGVQREYDEASGRLRKQKPFIEQEIISEARLVATTLTQLTLREAITYSAFDHVVIDEAAAAPLPHLAHAVGYAQTGAVLVGDYLQNGPIVDRAFPGGEEVQELFKTDCFSFFGATDPSQAQATKGCVVLTEQFRFGPALTELANRVAYRGILTTAGSGAADIVVITTDGLPEDVRAIHRGERKQAGWWLIGALLARALAEYHNSTGKHDAFGVVVPYVEQELATQAALDDSTVARATPAGTSHKFQGRQFDTVLADLVEDGQGRFAKIGPQARGFDADSIRLFNVAATRPRSRLYVLVGRRPLERARSGPLQALRSMVSDGLASRVDADALLGMFGAEPPPPDTPEADLVAALTPFVRVAGMHDEDAAIDEVIDRINGAHRSIWCWSAWVGRYATDLTDALRRAHDRGVSVHVMARPEIQVQESNRASLRNLTVRLPRVVFIQHMHQKIVVVDEQWSIVGSMNMLSYGPTSAKRIRDVMFTMEGASFARQLLQRELAAELRQHRSCPSCGQALVECGLLGSGRDRGWAWVCTANRAHHLKFPASKPGTARHRNERRRL